MVKKQARVTYILWFLLIGSAIGGVIEGNWSIVFTSIFTFILSCIPLILEHKTKIQLPTGFITAVVVFTVATLFLGEVGDFYERFWWWDLILHTGSAIAFGMIGTILVLLLLRGDKLNASSFLMSVFAFSFAVTIGVIWEIFEFAMDQFFGLNMQKSGLVDTMLDLCVNCLGAFIGSLAGFAYLKGKEEGPLSGAIAEFIKMNKIFFSKKQ